MFDSSNCWILFLLAFISWIGLCFLNALNANEEARNTNTPELNPIVYFITLIPKIFTVENHFVFAACLCISIILSIIGRYIFKKSKSIYCLLNYFEESLANCLKELENNNYYINYERRNYQKESAEYQKLIETYISEKNDLLLRAHEYKKCILKLRNKLLNVEGERDALKTKVDLFERRVYSGGDVMNSTTVLYDRNINKSNTNQLPSQIGKQVYSLYESAFIHQILNDTIKRDSDFKKILNSLNIKLIEMENFFFGTKTQKSAISNELQTQISKDLGIVSTEELEKIKFSNTDLCFKDNILDLNDPLVAKSKKFQDFCKNLYITLKK